MQELRSDAVLENAGGLGLSWFPRFGHHILAKHCRSVSSYVVEVVLRHEDSVVKLVVSDDGVGCSMDQPPSGLGSRLVQLLARQLGASIAQQGSVSSCRIVLVFASDSEVTHERGRRSCICASCVRGSSSRKVLCGFGRKTRDGRRWHTAAIFSYPPLGVP